MNPVVVVVLMLSLGVLASGTRSLPSAGFKLDIATALEECGDGRVIVVSAVGNHTVTLNSYTGWDIRDLPSRLREILKFRAEKLVFVRAEPNVSYREFVQLVDAVRPEAEIISLITPEIDAMVRGGRCLAVSCGRCDDLRSPVKSGHRLTEHRLFRIP